MNELIDNPESEIAKKIEQKRKATNLYIILFVLLIIGYNVYTVVEASMNRGILLPQYVTYFVNGPKINFILFSIPGLLIALFFRFKKQYVISSLFLVGFLCLSFIIKDFHNSYELFY